MRGVLLPVGENEIELLQPVPRRHRRGALPRDPRPDAAPHLPAHGTTSGPSWRGSARLASS